ncbi:hypothetical protein [Streptomyces virginiae]|uniref:hypothetical protein n=1 Tax=Streptomyces virginiae TaxID=1961 RepID=UPI00370076CE
MAFYACDGEEFDVGGVQPGTSHSCVADAQAGVSGGRPKLAQGGLGDEDADGWGLQQFVRGGLCGGAGDGLGEPGDDLVEVLERLFLKAKARESHQMRTRDAVMCSRFRLLWHSVMAVLAKVSVMTWANYVPRRRPAGDRER